MSTADPRKTYEQMLEQLAQGDMTKLQRGVFEALRDNPNGLDRYELVEILFGYRPDSVEGNIDDRKIRKAINRLRERLFPIVSTSRRPGYRLDVSHEAVTKMINELQSRKARIEEQIEAASKFYSIPVFVPDPSLTVTQLELNV